MRLRQELVVEVPHKLLHLESKLLVKDGGGVVRGDMEREVAAAADHGEAVEDEAPDPLAAPLWVHAEIGEVGLGPAGVRGEEPWRQIFGK